MNAEHNGPLRVEDEIDAALKVLGETQPPDELVSRVHRRLETGAVSHRTRLSRRFLIPAAGVAMATVALIAFFTPMHRAQENRGSAIETARPVANTSLAQATIMPPSAAAQTERSDEGKQRVQYYAKRRSRQSRETRHVTNLLSYPMTGEERLLVRFVQTAKPVDLQVLNPEYQAKVGAQQDAEFAAYLKSGSSNTESPTQTTESTQE